MGTMTREPCHTHQVKAAFPLRFLAGGGWEGEGVGVGRRWGGVVMVGNDL